MALAILGIIYEMMKGFVLLLPNLLKLVDAIVEYYVNRNKRARDAEINEELAKKQAAYSQMIKESANIAAFHSLVEEGWKLTYKDILEMVKANDYDKVLIKSQFVNNTEVNEILFSNQTAEYRTLLIVDKMRNAVN